ncbi:hypothetical protein QTP88_013992 [Uroleucon formosanum]
MEDEILIECVRKYTFIYDPTEKGHADMRLLKNTWEEVAKWEVLVLRAVNVFSHCHGTEPFDTKNCLKFSLTIKASHELFPPTLVKLFNPSGVFGSSNSPGCQ